MLVAPSDGTQNPMDWRLLVKEHMFLSGNLLASRKNYWIFPKNSALKLGTYFFLYKDTFIYHINLKDLKKQNLVAFLCVCVCVFEDMVVERSKNILNICPNLLHFFVNCTFWRC